MSENLKDNKKSDTVTIPRAEYEQLIRAVDDLKRFAGIITEKVTQAQKLVKAKA